MTRSERRIRNNKLRRKRQLRRNFYMILFSFLLISALSIGGFAIGSKAQDNSETTLYKYYTNIEVEYGQTLWDIADIYFCEEKYDNYNHYILEVMHLNGLYDTDISAGCYLIIPYYSTEFK